MLEPPPALSGCQKQPYGRCARARKLRAPGAAASRAAARLLRAQATPARIELRRASAKIRYRQPTTTPCPKSQIEREWRITRTLPDHPCLLRPLAMFNDARQTWFVTARAPPNSHIPRTH